LQRRTRKRKYSLTIRSKVHGTLKGFLAMFRKQKKFEGER